MSLEMPTIQSKPQKPAAEAKVSRPKEKTAMELRYERDLARLESINDLETLKKEVDEEARIMRGDIEHHKNTIEGIKPIQQRLGAEFESESPSAARALRTTEMALDYARTYLSFLERARAEVERVTDFNTDGAKIKNSLVGSFKEYEANIRGTAKIL